MQHIDILGEYHPGFFGYINVYLLFYIYIYTWSYIIKDYKIHQADIILVVFDAIAKASNPSGCQKPLPRDRWGTCNSDMPWLFSALGGQEMRRMRTTNSPHVWRTATTTLAVYDVYIVSHRDKTENIFLSKKHGKLKNHQMGKHHLSMVMFHIHVGFAFNGPFSKPWRHQPPEKRWPENPRGQRVGR